jgi:hypothetical protein
MIIKRLFICIIGMISIVDFIFGYVNINIDTTGLFIPYSVGVLAYIKKHLPINNYKLTGISGGTWCSILYHYEKDLSNPDKIWNFLINDDNYSIILNKNLGEFKTIVKHNMLKRYGNINFNKPSSHPPISVVVSKLIFNNILHKKLILNEKINKFNDLNELLEYSICSSYIPYISGLNITKKYKNINYMDGGLFTNINNFNKNNSFYIHRKMWNRKFNLIDNFYLDKKSNKKLFEYGWNDTRDNINILLKLL